jgi:hypothetical protein
MNPSIYPSTNEREAADRARRSAGAAFILTAMQNPLAPSFPSSITVNVIVSGHIVIEFISTPNTDAADAAAAKALTDKLTKPTADLLDAESKNPVPTP